MHFYSVITLIFLSFLPVSEQVGKKADMHGDSYLLPYI